MSEKNEGIPPPERGKEEGGEKMEKGQALIKASELLQAQIKEGGFSDWEPDIEKALADIKSGKITEQVINILDRFAEHWKKASEDLQDPDEMDYIQGEKKHRKILSSDYNEKAAEYYNLLDVLEEK